MIVNPRMRSVMQHDFSTIPHADITRSVFNRSHGIKTMFNGGELIPIFWDETLPGDTFNLNMNAVCRLTTPLVPVMDNLFMDFFFFFVPNRLIWDNWQKFMGEQVDPGDSTDYTIPTISDSGGGFGHGSLYDYFGIPPGVAGTTVNALHFRAYNLIWNEWFRDQNMQDSLTVNKDDGPDTVTDAGYVKIRGKRHDYFTSCLPWPQKGTEIDLPLGDNAPIKSEATRGAAEKIGALDTSDTLSSFIVSGSDIRLQNTTPDYSLFADLSNATASTINSLREAFQLQKMLERDARGGTRYTEIIRSHFGVTSPDQRLQRPEYLGGGSVPINIQAVYNTMTDATDNQLGDLGAVGHAEANGVGFTKSFVEHGVLIGLVNVRADINYQQGLDRMWSRQTRYDFYFPALAHLGEQEVYNKEIYLQGTAGGSDDDDVFGYQERWAEYRHKMSTVTGVMRSSNPVSMDIWHLALDFSALPALNDAFIKDAPPIERIAAVYTEPQLKFDGYINLRCTRPMPTYSVPGYIDHF